VQRFILLAFFGLIAQLVDGSLGMAYGLTSTTLLLASGLTPALASASVHMAEVGTTLVSGVAHSRLGNTNWYAVRWLALPGGVGAFCGALALGSISAEFARPWVATFLVLLGFYVLLRFTVLRRRKLVASRPIRARFLAPLGLGAGFMDAAGGGGWGPISTPTLLSTGRMSPRQVVGTVDTSEFVVALCASVGFIIAIGLSSISFVVVGALLAGGVVAAPLAALLVRKMHPNILGAAVGGMIVCTNARTVVNQVSITATVQALVYVGVILIWIAALVFAVQIARRERLLSETMASGD
jgi:uncharacterized protein